MRCLPWFLSFAASSFVGAQEVRAQDVVETTLSRLSLRAKAGQVLMLWSLSRAEGQAGARERLLQEVRELGLGGVVLSLGSVEDAARWVTELQAAAPLPLLMAGDFEAGVAFRLAGATDLGKAMLLGASGDAELARTAGRWTAREAKALGMHWNFAPVLDVNVNPDNPIINVRSFGEDPALVARLGAAYALGVQEEGVLATAKHFPGHGDVAIDSHLDMPTVPGDRARLDAIELLPFRAAIRAGIATIMTGHLAVPGLNEDPRVPATLSPRICTEVLRGELGFGGLIVTDALDMGGVKGKREPADVAVRALLAGADVLLMPPEPARVRDAIVTAVESGHVPAARLDEAVRRILAAKARAGLLDGKGLPAADWRAVIGRAEHAAAAREIAVRGLTLVRDVEGLWPLAATAAPCVVELSDGDEGATGAKSLAAALGGSSTFSLHRESSAGACGAAAQALAAAEVCVVAMHVRVRAHSGAVALPAVFAPVIAALQQHPRAVVVSFGNPYLLRDLPGVSTFACAYETTAATVAAAAAALRGASAVTGRLPVSIPGAAALGDGLSWMPITGAGPLPRTSAPAAGFASDLEARVRTLLEAGVAARAFPGAVCLVARRGLVVGEVAVGRETYDPASPAVTPATRFDLASLTKVCATLPLTLRLFAQGKLQPSSKVAALVPEFVGPGKERVTVLHLLTHSAGLPGYAQFWKLARGRDAIVHAAAAEGLRTEPAAEAAYSDLGMILLMACLEKAAGEGFAELVQREVLVPLGMQSATFASTGTPIEAAPTEDCAWRGRIVRGEVHDENAFAMGGVSGHAGLFGTAGDVVRVGLMFLGGGGGYLPATQARQATRRAGVVPGSARALGFDTFTPGGAAGSLLHASTFGHTGFTGTSMWCDPSRDLCVVLLTNRVHPTRVNAKIQQVRRDLHDLIVRALVR